MKKKDERKGKRTAKKLISFFLVIVLALCALGLLKGNSTRYATMKNGWNLVLVNESYALPKNWECRLITLKNGEQIDERIYPDLQEMFNDARREGLGLFVRSGYRTKEDQAFILMSKTNQFKNSGMTRSKALEEAKKWVAEPGKSEHQLGLSVDINPDTKVSSGERVYAWLESNSYRYGFIKRYPDNKVEITKISNEPWHYRYVGKKAAKEMYESGLCLEEYLNKK